jgi:hypothetical protein
VVVVEENGGKEEVGAVGEIAVASLTLSSPGARRLLMRGM